MGVVLRVLLRSVGAALLIGAALSVLFFVVAWSERAGVGFVDSETGAINWELLMIPVASCAILGPFVFPVMLVWLSLMEFVEHRRRASKPERPQDR